MFHDNEPFVYAGEDIDFARAIATELAERWGDDHRNYSLNEIDIFDMSFGELLDFFESLNFNLDECIAVALNPVQGRYYFVQPTVWYEEDVENESPVADMEVRDAVGIELHGEQHVPWPDEIAAMKTTEAEKPKDVSSDVAANIRAAFE